MLESEVFRPFGPDSDDVGQRIVEVMVEMHEAMTNSQEATTFPGQSSYGLIWKYLPLRLSAALKATVLEVQSVRPGQAPYELPVLKGHVLVPWRVPGAQDPRAAKFATTGTRRSLWSLSSPEEMLALDGLPDQTVLAEDADLQAVLAEVAGDKLKVVLIAMQSVSGRLHLIEWGEVTLREDGRLLWGASAVLLDGSSGEPVPASVDGPTFADGEVPEPQVSSRPEAEDGVLS